MHAYLHIPVSDKGGLDTDRTMAQEQSGRFVDYFTTYQLQKLLFSVSKFRKASIYSEMEGTAKEVVVAYLKTASRIHNDGQTTTVKILSIVNHVTEITLRNSVRLPVTACRQASSSQILTL
jgi:phosphoglycerol transferase MdoB-like AlkP superfamily enzyme